MTVRRAEQDFWWLDLLATVSTISERNTVEVDAKSITDARLALKEINRLRVEVERLEVRNENYRKVIDDSVGRWATRVRLDAVDTRSLLDEIHDRSQR